LPCLGTGAKPNNLRRQTNRKGLKKPEDLFEMKLLNVGECAEKIRMKKSWVYEHVRNRCPESEKLPHLKIGAFVLFDSDDIDRWLEAQKVKPHRNGDSRK
jgi:predicted DNA-binding transcriptional regulator AlpA